MFIKKFLNTSIGDVVKSAIKVSPLSAIRLGCGFLRSKMSALLIGVTGVGVLGQANQFLLLITTIGSLGMVNSLMQQMSQYKAEGDSEKLMLVKGTVFSAQLVCLAAFVLVMLFFYEPITFFFFNTTHNSFSLLVLLISIFAVLNVLASNYLEGFFTSYFRFDLYVKASSIVTVLSFLAFIPSIYFWRVNGGLVSIIVGEILLFVIFLFYVLKIEKLKNIFVFRFDKAIFKFTFTDGMINLLCAFLFAMIGLYLRQLLLKNVGEFKAGIYQFCLSITAYYTPFLTNLLWSKYFPTISSKKITEETQLLIKDTLRFMVVSAALLTGGIMIFAESAIKILASGDFIIAKQYLPIQFLGDFWYFIFYVFSIYLLAMRYTKRYLLMWVLFLASQYLLSITLIDFCGLYGVVAAYSISSILVGSLALFSFKKILQAHARSVYITILISFVLVVVEAILTLLSAHVILRLAVMGVWIFWFAKPIISSKFKH